nr:MAG TPA: hypothetical protein [Caudoviricetes sp.]
MVLADPLKKYTNKTHITNTTHENLFRVLISLLTYKCEYVSVRTPHYKLYHQYERKSVRQDLTLPYFIFS